MTLVPLCFPKWVRGWEGVRCLAFVLEGPRIWGFADSQGCTHLQAGHLAENGYPGSQLSGLTLLL